MHNGQGSLIRSSPAKRRREREKKMNATDLSHRVVLPKRHNLEYLTLLTRGCTSLPFIVLLLLSRVRIIWFLATLHTSLPNTHRTTSRILPDLGFIPTKSRSHRYRAGPHYHYQHHSSPSYHFKSTNANARNNSPSLALAPSPCSPHHQSINYDAMQIIILLSHPRTTLDRDATNRCLIGCTWAARKRWAWVLDVIHVWMVSNTKYLGPC